MKFYSINSHPGRSVGLVRGAAWLVALTGVLALAATLQAQTYYDFDNGTNTGWRSSTAHPSTITYPTDALGGRAYRLQGTPMASGFDTNARVFSVLTNRIYTNFYAAVDVVSWNTNQDSEMVIGLLARANGNEAFKTNSGQYQASGYPFNPDEANGLTFNVRLHNKRSYIGPTNNGPLGSADQMSVWSINYTTLPEFFYEAYQLGNPVAVTTARFRWVPGHAYRLVLSSTNTAVNITTNYTPTYYTCSIYDVNDLTKPLFSVTGDDSYGGGTLTADTIPLYGYVGVLAYKLRNEDFDPNVDVTFDNFYVGETAPVTAVVAPAIPHGKPGAPQVINRVPVSFKNFHPAASGITFNATTLTTTNTVNTNAIKLYLNGVDVSSGLSITGPTTNASVSYSGLASNVVYDARIELQDALGRRTTNEWTFDTFSDTYLTSSSVKVIEAEDYNFDGGSFIDDPPASGYYDYIAIPESGTIINDTVGYVDRIGTGGGVDFYDTDSGIHTAENQYRHTDPVGTQQGNTALLAFGDISVNPLPYNVSQSYENQRSKYSSVNPTLKEYIVERTRGGEWLNYTRVFDGSKTYNAYLRASGSLAQPVRFDQIVTNGPVTNLLGRFNVPSTFFAHNYRYTPLVNTNGELALVNLSLTNTIRLMMDSLDNDGARDGVALNYVVLVPAAPQLYSSTTVNGTYTPEPNVLVDAGNKKFTVPRSGTTRFYKIRWTSALTISGLTFSGPNVVLSYQ